MDMIWKIGEFLLILTMVAAMLYMVANAEESINDTQEYVTKQNHSDAYANRYASLSSFDADSVGQVSVQEALNLVYTYADDSTPVIVKGPDNKIHVFASGKWKYSTAGKNLGDELSISGSYVQKQYTKPSGGICYGRVDAFQTDTEAVPLYEELYTYLKGDPLPAGSQLLGTGFDSTNATCVTKPINVDSPVNYWVNINPDGKGNLQTILLIATN